MAEQDGQTIGYVQICDTEITVKEHTVDEGSQAINAIYYFYAYLICFWCSFASLNNLKCCIS